MGKKRKTKNTANTIRITVTRRQERLRRWLSSRCGKGPVEILMMRYVYGQY